MVIAKRIKYQNFMLCGNAPIEVHLNASPMTLITGINGTGKSTLNEAICFASFGRPLRGVNKPALINQVNKSCCEVEFEFEAQGVNYLVKRGMKPNIFEIYQNGHLIPAPASIADYQTMLENTILKLNYKSFMQIVILGGSNYVPFMRLTANARREVIEDLLDIEIFSSMNALAKDDLSNLKAEIDKTSQAKTLVGKQVEMARSITDKLNIQRDELIANVEYHIAKTQTEINDLAATIAAQKVRLNEYDAVKASYDVAKTKLGEYEKTLFAIEAREKKLQKERTFYEKHDSCPTCEQSITEDFKKERYELLTKKESEAAIAVEKCKKLVDKYTMQRDNLKTKLSEADSIRQNVTKLSGTLPIHRNRLAELQSEFESYQMPAAPVQEVDIDQLEKQLQDLHEQHDNLSRKRVITDAANMLLRDNGIKTKIIKHYLPIINKTINQYLTAMDFPIIFTLDEQFEEHIKSRYREEFSYELFSDGEKKRIDLALLLTWRTIAKIKNSAACNLLILDEVFDSSLDAAGTEEFLKIIRNFEAGTNVFVISHKGDVFIDKFANSITFEKVRGFSQLKA